MDTSVRNFKANKYSNINTTLNCIVTNKQTYELLGHTKTLGPDCRKGQKQTKRSKLIEQVTGSRRVKGLKMEQLKHCSVEAQEKNPKWREGRREATWGSSEDILENSYLVL